MTIKEVSEKFNISADTLRYYEKEGLIQDVPRVSRRRDYGQKEIDLISFVICMRSAGLPIEVLKEYLSLVRQGDKTIKKRFDMLVNQREILKTKIDEMNAAFDKLNYKINSYNSMMLKAEKKLQKASTTDSF